VVARRGAGVFSSFPLENLVDLRYRRYVCRFQATAGNYLARFYLRAKPMYSFIKGTWWYDFSEDTTNPNDLFVNFCLYTWLAAKPSACAG
jgi:hypothetical protein